MKLAEGRGFEPPVGLLLRLISSQVPLTTQPPFRKLCTIENRQFGPEVKSGGQRKEKFLAERIQGSLTSVSGFSFF